MKNKAKNEAIIGKFSIRYGKFFKIIGAKGPKY